MIGKERNRVMLAQEEQRVRVKRRITKSPRQEPLLLW